MHFVEWAKMQITKGEQGCLKWQGSQSKHQKIVLVNDFYVLIPSNIMFLSFFCF